MALPRFCRVTADGSFARILSQAYRPVPAGAVAVALAGVGVRVPAGVAELMGMKLGTVTVTPGPLRLRFTVSRAWPVPQPVSMSAAHREAATRTWRGERQRIVEPHIDGVCCSYATANRRYVQLIPGSAMAVVRCFGCRSNDDAGRDDATVAYLRGRRGAVKTWVTPPAGKSGPSLGGNELNS